MPELPEVEVVRRGLDRHVVGRTVAHVAVAHPRATRRHLPGPDDLAARLVGRTVTAARRRGKYLWLPLDSGDALVVHLGMSGQLLVSDRSRPEPAHLRVVVRFTDGGPDLRFVDQRTFGGLDWAEGGAQLPAQVAHIARDLLDPAEDDAAVGRAMRRRRTEVKRALLDQTLVSGIGNIYADEALWQVRLSGRRPTDRLTAGQAVGVLGAARSVMFAALAAGGTSFDALYVNVNGASGGFDRSLEVYGREGLPCRRCGTPIRRDRFMNRSSFTCPTCQPAPRRPPAPR